MPPGAKGTVGCDLVRICTPSRSLSSARAISGRINSRKRISGRSSGLSGKRLTSASVASDKARVTSRAHPGGSPGRGNPTPPQSLSSSRRSDSVNPPCSSRCWNSASESKGGWAFHLASRFWPRSITSLDAEDSAVAPRRHCTRSASVAALGQLHSVIPHSLMRPLQRRWDSTPTCPARRIPWPKHPRPERSGPSTDSHAARRACARRAASTSGFH